MSTILLWCVTLYAFHGAYFSLIIATDDVFHCKDISTEVTGAYAIYYSRIVSVNAPQSTLPLSFPSHSHLAHASPSLLIRRFRPSR